MPVENSKNGGRGDPSPALPATQTTISSFTNGRFDCLAERVVKVRLF